MSEADTIRILRGEKPMQKLKCRLGFHSWSTWEVTEGDLSRYTSTYARCKCVDCGFPREETPYSKTRRRNEKRSHEVDKLKAKQKVIEK